MTRTSLLKRSVVAAFVTIFALVAYAKYSFESAKKDAEEFCSEIMTGSDIQMAAARAKQRDILFGSGDQYVFIFPAFTGFDKAVCNVWVDRDGKVVTKSWEMQYD